MRRDRQRLNDILEALDWIARAIAGRNEAEFLADETLCYAVAQRLAVIGEAVARLSPEVTALHNSVPWPDIALHLRSFFSGRDDFRGVGLQATPAFMPACRRMPARQARGFACEESPE